MINYLTVGVNPPPLDKKIIVKKDFDAHVFDDGAKIVVLESNHAKQDEHCMDLICAGFTLWSEV